jgi:hypothetical protein
METTNRGFYKANSIQTNYHGQVTVKESSNAMAPHIWIFTEKSPYSQDKPDTQYSIEEAKQLHTKLGEMIEILEDRWEGE